MEAYLKGEIIQYRLIRESDTFQWERVDLPIWNFDKYDYRVEPNYDGDRAKHNLIALIRAAREEGNLKFMNQDVKIPEFEAEEMYAYLNAISSEILGRNINKE